MTPHAISNDNIIVNKIKNNGYFQRTTHENNSQ